MSRWAKFSKSAALRVNLNAGSFLLCLTVYNFTLSREIGCLVLENM